MFLSPESHFHDQERRGKMARKFFDKRKFHKLIAPIEAPLKRVTAKLQSDKRYRKFFTRSHVLSWIYVQISDLESLRDLEGALKEDEQVQELVECEGIDISTLSRANERRSFKVFRYLFHALFPKAWGKAGEDLGGLSTLKKLKILDSSFLRCCASMGWAHFKKTARGVRMHLLLDFKRIPEKLVLTGGTGSDRDVLRQLFRRGVTYIVDRGYTDYKLFEKIARKGAFLVTRLLKNAVYEIVEALPLSQEALQKGILGDFKIRLGGPRTRVSVLLRLVIYQAEDGKLFTFLTNRWDLSPWIICEIYRHRWSIELFFRWIKMPLKVKHFLGRSENAVLIQLYAALIAFLLLQLFGAQVYDMGKVTRRLLMRVRRLLFAPASEEEIVAYLAAIDSS